jgi:TM2 domain-containing membrane protein YozV
MFSNSQLIFALFFIITFLIILIISYSKDKKQQKEYFKGTYKILIVFFLILSSLFLIKFLTQH